MNPQNRPARACWCQEPTKEFRPKESFAPNAGHWEKGSQDGSVLQGVFDSALNAHYITILNVPNTSEYILRTFLSAIIRTLEASQKIQPEALDHPDRMLTQKSVGLKLGASWS